MMLSGVAFSSEEATWDDVLSEEVDDMAEFEVLNGLEGIEDVEFMVEETDDGDVDNAEFKELFGRWGRLSGLKRGICPTVEASNETESNETESESCEDTCAGNKDCSGRQLCCEQGCGRVCVLPEGTVHRC